MTVLRTEVEPTMEVAEQEMVGMLAVRGLPAEMGPGRGYPGPHG